MLILDPYFMAFRAVVFFGLSFEFLFELGFIILCKYVKLHVQYLSWQFMAMRVVEFSNGVYKIRKNFA